MTTKIKLILLALLPAIALGGCAVVHQDEIGVKRTAGKLREETLSPGMYAVGPFSRVLKLPNHVINLEIALDLLAQCHHPFDARHRQQVPPVHLLSSPI